MAAVSAGPGTRLLLSFYLVVVVGPISWTFVLFACLPPTRLSRVVLLSPSHHLPMHTHTHVRGDPRSLATHLALVVPLNASRLINHVCLVANTDRSLVSFTFALFSVTFVAVPHVQQFMTLTNITTYRALRCCPSSPRTCDAIDMSEQSP